MSFVHRRLLIHKDVQRAAAELIDKVSFAARVSWAECFYDSPPPMPATVSKPIPRLFSLIFFFLLVRSVHLNVIIKTSLSRIYFFSLAT